MLDWLCYTIYKLYKHYCICKSESLMSNSIGSSSNLDGTFANPTGKYLVYFAAERTLMAWIRAALGLMALGFVIDRFGLVVRTIAPHARIIQPSTFSFLAGAGLVVGGAVMAAVAAVRYTHFAWRYRQTGDTEPGYGLGPAIFFTAVVGLAGAFIAGYLMIMTP
jgi:inner membrane protein YidH